MSEAALLARMDSLEGEMNRQRDGQDRIWQALDSINKTLSRIEEALKHYQAPGTTTHCKMQDNRLEGLERKVEALAEKMAWYSGAAAVGGAIFSIVASKFLGK